MKEFGNSVIRKGIPKNEDLDIIFDIVGKSIGLINKKIYYPISQYFIHLSDQLH